MLPLFAIYFLWILWSLVWVITTFGPVKGFRKLNIFEEILYRAAALFATALLFTITPWPGLDVQYRLWQRAPDSLIAWRLVIIAAVALCFSWWALIHRITAFKRGAVIVTTGPYRILRHPVYAGLIVAMFATAFLFGRPSSFMGAVLFMAAFVLKVQIEEWRSSGPEFEAYTQRSMMFVPLLGLIIFQLRRLWPKKPKSPAGAPLFVSPRPAVSPPPPSQGRRPAMAAAQPPAARVSPSLHFSAVPFELVLDDEPAPGDTRP